MFEKSVDRVAELNMVEERLRKHARTGKARRAVHDFGIRRDGVLSRVLVLPRI